MKRKKLAGAALGAATLALAVLSACADSLSAGTDTPPPQKPTLADPDAVAPVPPPEAGLCNAYECPAPYATCPGTSGLCTTNLATDIEHCGACDNECPNSLPIRQKLHASFACAKSRCQMLCAGPFGDCNGLVDDGCETSLDDDPMNCGLCGVACKAGEICWKGGCGCPSGYTQCGDSCVQLDQDDSNCGACGHQCTDPPPDAGPTVWPCGPSVVPPASGVNCLAAKCGVHCSPGFGNCNTDACGDGCETFLLTDHDHCGACGNKCRDDQACVGGKCICDADKTRCGGDCVDLESDPLNCGACGNACPGATGDGFSVHGSPICTLGRCGYDCPPGYADCDHRIENGCEVDLMVDPNHCGSCSAQCDLKGGQPCAGGRCLTKPCDAGVVH
jgi:hypothetical protein